MRRLKTIKNCATLLPIHFIQLLIIIQNGISAGKLQKYLYTKNNKTSLWFAEYQQEGKGNIKPQSVFKRKTLCASYYFRKIFYTFLNSLAKEYSREILVKKIRNLMYTLQSDFILQIEVPTFFLLRNFKIACGIFRGIFRALY